MTDSPMAIPPAAASTVDRARQSEGISNRYIHAMVLRALRRRTAAGGTLIDFGCGTGSLAAVLAPLFDRYIGADVVRYDGFLEGGEFQPVDPASGRISLPDSSADVVVAVETIEHLENPRELVRELHRLTRPGGWVVVTTPNQLSLLNILSLVLKGRHVQFQDVHYPTHLSALLEVDLRRMAAELGLREVAIEYSERGRIPLTGAFYPRAVARLAPRWFSDNVLMIGRKPEARATGAREGPAGGARGE